MDNTKLHYHNLLNKNENVLLAKLNGRGTIIIDASSGGVVISLYKTGYYCHGPKLSSAIDIYYKDGSFYIVKNTTKQPFITIQGISSFANTSLINGYAEPIDVSTYTKLPVLNKPLPYKVEYSSSFVDSNTPMQYTSIMGKKLNMAQCSLILLSVRNSNNSVGGNALIFLSRFNISSYENFTAHVIYSDNDISSFTISGNDTGFTMESPTSFKYYITEIAVPGQI